VTPNQPPLGSASNDGTDPTVPPTVAYMTMFADANGASSLSSCQLAGFTQRGLGGKAAPMWMQKFQGAPAEVWFTVLPRGWVGEWHESPAPQWVCALSGRWWIETADGQRIEMGPGEIHWGQDQSTTDARGHRSGQCGEEPCVQMMVRYASPPGNGGPCPFDGDA
jgi:hypothetical protein